jgi:plastocyanin
MTKIYLVVLMLSLLLLTFATTTVLPTSNLGRSPLSVYGQTVSMATLPNIGATYAVSIIPGAAQKSSLIHYYPPLIAVPVGTTIAWFNNDPGQPHTVTNGLPGSSSSGNLFNSGIMPATANSFFQYTFNKAGDFSYYCKIHPWRVAIVSTSSALERGNHFQLSSGTGPTLNLTRDVRTLLDFTPLTVPLDKSTPITYNITIFKNKTDNVFSQTFTVIGDKLPLELIAAGTDTNETRVYGPDFSSTGAYHLEAPFLKGNADYNIRAAIIAINAKQPQNQITDDFTLHTIS